MKFFNLFKKKTINDKQVEVDQKFLDLVESFNHFQETPHQENVILEIKDLKKWFGPKKKRHHALQGINLKIYEGDRIALLGANGAGKTTLLEIIAGINKPSEGTIDYNFNYQITPQERIGIQFQDATCPFGFTVYDLIQLQNNILIQPLSNSDILKLIKVFKLKDLLKVKAASLSGGQQQRLNVALTFMTDPKILFLDELSTALDIDMQLYINKIVKEYADEHNTTLVLSSHNIKEILFHTTRCVIIKKGKVVLDVPNEAIIKHFKDFDHFLTNFINNF
ncbi:MAG: ABC transporter ATP-binding protein [Mycoplasma sp.]